VVLAGFLEEFHANLGVVQREYFVFYSLGSILRKKYIKFTKRRSTSILVSGK
jgi:hypothetical protein